MPTITRSFHEELLNTIRDTSRYNKWFAAPINLGGVPGATGGSGEPPGGIFGQLIQTKVAYDTTEATYSGIQTNLPSGSLVDNLAHLRWRLSNLEAISGVTFLDVYEDGVLVESDVTIIDFTGDGVSVSNTASGRVLVTVSGTDGGISSIAIRDEGVSQGNATILDFVGSAVEASVSGDVATITITATTASGTTASGYKHIFEDLTAQVPASGGLYTISQAMVEDSLSVYINGLRQRPSQYTETSTTTFTTTDPQAGDNLIVDYLITVSGGSGGGGTGYVSVKEDGVIKVSQATALNFTTGATITNAGGGQANIAVEGGGGTNLDGGTAESTYGGITAIDGGDATSF